MEFLAKKNPHPRDTCIRFQDEGHKYFINEGLLTGSEDSGTDDSYKSVTTFIHDLFPKFNADLVISKMMTSAKWKDSKYFGMTAQQIKETWSLNAKKASQQGTKLHNDIELFYNEVPVENESKEYQHFLKFAKDHEGFEPYRTEWTLWDSESQICGSVDMLYINQDGTLTIYDWKRSKEIKRENSFQKGGNKLVSDLDDCNFEHYSLQLNMYKYLIEKNYGFKVSEIAIIVFHPSNMSYRKYKVRNLQDLVDKLIQERIDNLEEIVEVEELFYKGQCYLVDCDGNIIDEETGVVKGQFPGKLR